MREEDDEVLSAPVLVVGEGIGQSSDGHAMGRSAEEEDDDLVPLNQRLKRSRPSVPEGGLTRRLPLLGRRLQALHLWVHVLLVMGVRG